ncbi:protein kinase domain-containing protein [Patulibacter defluvii]|uniref:protein kinase domain-containing protein n=1 Tax=Patulibacter defluvii TaxID=3095358 RepID=UPI002A757A2A|nr:protein kinase [Patulibacter sp. DM4]
MSGELAVGARIGAYRIDAVAGRGGMGIVYRATQLTLDRPVALKVIAPALADDPAFRARFVREARLLAALEHPHVIPVHEADERDGQLYLAMRWVEGTDLSAALRRLGPLPPTTALAVVEQLASALDAAHASGLVHRDVKPANVLLEPRDGRDHAWLSDFGAGRWLDSRDGRTATGHGLGTLDFAAPEQLEGGGGPAVDVYALAGVLFTVLSGRKPFVRDNDLAVLWAHQHAPPPDLRELRPELPAALAQAVIAGMAKDPAARPASATALVAAARAALREAGMGTGDGEAAGTGPTITATGIGTLRPPAVPVEDVLGLAVTTGSPPGPGDTWAREAGAGGGAGAAVGAGAAGGGGPDGGSGGTGRTLVRRATQLPALATATRRRALLAVAATALAGGGALGASSGDQPTAPKRPPAATLPAPRIERIALGERAFPNGVAARSGQAYVIDGRNRRLLLIDDATRQVSQRLKLPSAPITVLHDDYRDRLWIATADRRLLAYDTGTGKRVLTLRVGFPAQYLAVRPDAVTAMSAQQRGGASLATFSATSGRRLATARGPVRPNDLVEVATGVLALGSIPPTVVRFDDRLRRRGDAPVKDAGLVVPEMAVDGRGRAWITSFAEGTVVRVDGLSGKPAGRPVRVGRDPSGVAIDGDGIVWVVNQRDRTLTRIDAKSGRVLGRPVPVGGPTKGLIVAEGDVVWLLSARELLRIEQP